MRRISYLVIAVITAILLLRSEAVASDLCWYHIDGADYRLSLIDIDSGEEVFKGPVMISELAVERRDSGLKVVRYPVPSEIVSLIPSSSPLEYWVVTSQKMLQGELAVSIPTIIDELRCDPPYIVYPPQLKADFTCDEKISIVDSLKHIHSEIIGPYQPCEMETN